MVIFSMKTGNLMSHQNSYSSFSTDSHKSKTLFRVDVANVLKYVNPRRPIILKLHSKVIFIYVQYYIFLLNYGKEANLFDIYRKGLETRRDVSQPYQTFQFSLDDSEATVLIKSKVNNKLLEQQEIYNTYIIQYSVYKRCGNEQIVWLCGTKQRWVEVTVRSGQSVHRRETL